jgi:uncharacterized damage-inducible protein DinB
MGTTNTTVNPITATWFINSKEFLDHWQGHRRVTKRVIEAFPADKLFDYSIGGMRPFAAMANEIISMSGAGIKGIATDNWVTEGELDHHTGANEANSKEGLMKQWDKVTEDLNFFWPQISEDRFRQIVLAFGQYEGEAYGIIQYFVDNEIHHRAQGTVYLRSLGIEPPAFWDRD